ncbi:YHYH protein [Microscilla marina]|uniref:Lipoprotein, putative n=1 Tax=Microscilla marina ATCC 23134 TaxID=313606 RepID=A1ZCU6_MICM2|nr:YHYH protein [Microscilla marina]EAY32098.1 lipoprotein, putative [Microscilla marina ATCC 23134]
MKKIPVLLIALFVCIGITSCKKDADDATPTTTNTGGSDTTSTGTELPEAFKLFINDTEAKVDGDFVVITAKGVPDHKSPYWARNNALYEAYNGSNVNFKQNPNVIAEQNFTFRIPLNPAEATNKAATPFGAIGVTVNGVAIFNQYAAPGDDLSAEINTFDQHNGHPTSTGMYHYHIEPTYLTTNNKEGLVGFLLDGFPVYGPQENGKTIVNSDLDIYHGHTAATKEYPNGIYHYHITDNDPYINGQGFFGTAGTVTQ